MSEQLDLRPADETPDDESLAAYAQRAYL